MFLLMYTTIENALRSKTGLGDVQLTDGGEHADLATTVAFALAKERKQSPVIMAEELARKLTGEPGFEQIQVTVKGPYINFLFGPSYVSRTLQEVMVHLSGYAKLSTSSRVSTMAGGGTRWGTHSRSVLSRPRHSILSEAP